MASSKTQEGGSQDINSKVPRSKRGERTRGALIEAARTVFERDGFLDARLTDVTKEAGVSSGSFYTYFDSKEEVFAAVVQSLETEMFHPHVHEMLGDNADPIALIEASNREYLRSYKRNARLMAVIEQMAQIDEEFREVRRNRGHDAMIRNTRFIERLQKEGLADPTLDARMTAHALSAMVARMAYQVYALGESGKFPFEQLVASLTKVWANTLKLSE